MEFQKLVEAIATKARVSLNAVSDEASLEEWRITFLGRNGELTSLLRSLRKQPLDERKVIGQIANQLKGSLQKAWKSKKEGLGQARVIRAVEEGRLDVTLPPRPLAKGRLHPITQTQRQIVEAFVCQGFSVVEGPEVELDYYNFEALRIPQDHPARELMDTFYLEQDDASVGRVLLRTHTSPGQIRFMENHPPPIRIISPGRTYRNEATDPSHEWMITQTEVLAVDEGLNLAQLKGTLFEFARRLFGRERRFRFRCDFFRFVEPGVDMSIDCFICQGKGCRTCKYEGWIEILGAGMVHPEILENMGYDPKIYTGFAAGLGVERITMLRYGIEDIRLFYENDQRFLDQF